MPQIPRWQVWRLYPDNPGNPDYLGTVVATNRDAAERIGRERFGCDHGDALPDIVLTNDGPEGGVAIRLDDVCLQMTINQFHDLHQAIHDWWTKGPEAEPKNSASRFWKPQGVAATREGGTEDKQ